MGQLTPFDLVVLLIISNAVQNAVIGNDNSLGGGLIGVVAILIRQQRIERLLGKLGRFPLQPTARSLTKLRAND